MEKNGTEIAVKSLGSKRDVETELSLELGRVVETKSSFEVPNDCQNYYRSLDSAVFD